MRRPALFFVLAFLFTSIFASVANANDIVGLRLGMSFDETMKILKSYQANMYVHPNKRRSTVEGKPVTIPPAKSNEFVSAITARTPASAELKENFQVALSPPTSQWPCSCHQA